MKIFARAPGKIIITGEHFVVHGSTALAAALSRGVTVKAEEHEGIKIISKNMRSVADYPENVPADMSPLVECVLATVKEVGFKKGFRLTIDSEIPPGSGLGSSSATSVACVAAVSALAGANLSREKLVDLAMVCERGVHVNPSGIDPNVATHGGVILFRKGGAPEHVKPKNSAEFVVAFSGIPRETSKLIEKVSMMKERHPLTFEALAASSSTLSRLAASSLSSMDLPTLGAILNFYHAVLRWLGVSVKALDSLVETFIKAGCLGAKLTGAGGGGSVIGLPRRGEADKVIAKIRGGGIQAFTTKIPQDGVRVWPG